jgi:hypothetical protein
MRTLTLAAITAVSLAVLSLPAAAVPTSPVSGISSPKILTQVRMRGHHMMRRHAARPRMTWAQRGRTRR